MRCVFDLLPHAACWSAVAAGAKTNTFHGAVFGDGVYCANNPDTFANYGDTCLLCAVMRGKERRIGPAQADAEHCLRACWEWTRFWHRVVLLGSHVYCPFC